MEVGFSCTWGERVSPLLGTVAAKERGGGDEGEKGGGGFGD